MYFTIETKQRQVGISDREKRQNPNAGGQYLETFGPFASREAAEQCVVQLSARSTIQAAEVRVHGGNLPGEK